MFTIRDSDGFFHYFREFYYNIVLAETIGEEKYITCPYSYIFHTGTVKIKLFEIENRKHCLWRYTICRDICKPPSIVDHMWNK